MTYEHQTAVTTKILWSRLRPLNINRRIWDTDYRQPCPWAVSSRPRVVLIKLGRHNLDLLDPILPSWVMSTTTKRSGDNKWRISRPSSGPLVGSFLIVVTDRPGKQRKNPSTKKTINKVVNDVVYRTAKIRSRHLTKIPCPLPAYVRVQADAATTMPQARDLRQTANLIPATTMLFCRALRHQIDRVRKTNFPGTYGGHPQCIVPPTTDVKYSIRQLYNRDMGSQLWDGAAPFQKQQGTNCQKPTVNLESRVH